MNTDFLRGFVEIARKKSIAKASEDLHISHTALSKQLQSLEKQYDVRLFTRSSSGVKLTAAGQILYDYAIQILEQLSALSTALGPHREWTRLSIGTIPDIAARYLTPALSGLQRDGRQADLVLCHATNEAYDLLQRGEVDVLIAERVPMHPSVWMTDLYHEPLYTVVAADHPLAGQEVITLEELSREALVLYPNGCAIRAKLTTLFEASYLPMNIKTEVGFHEVILGYVSSGTGITVLPESLVWNLASSRIRIIPFNIPAACRTISITSFQPDKADKLLPLIRQAFSAPLTAFNPKIETEI